MLFEVIILIIVFLILWTVQINLEKKWKNFPPGPIQIPIIGHLIQLAMMKNSNKAPYYLFKEWALKNGPLTSLQFGSTRTVIMDDPDIVKEVLFSDIWSDRYFDLLYGLRSFDHPYGLLFSSGDEWKEIRRFSQRIFREFGFGKNKNQEIILHEELYELMSRLDSQIDTNKLEIGKLTISMEKFFTISVLNILWTIMIGERFSYDDIQLKNISDLTSKIIRDNPIGGNLGHAFPSRFSRNLMAIFTGKVKRLQEYVKQMQQYFQNMLNERRALGFYKNEQKNFIEFFLKEIDNHKNDDGPSINNFYSDNQFLVVALDLFIAGSETTTNTLEFAILHMILNPNIQKKIQAEIDHVVGTSRFPSYTLDRSKMPYTEATLHEIQRMTSVVPIDNRSVTQDTILRGYFIPKGTSGIINIHSVHYNEKLWDEPNIFKPERFLDELNNIVNVNKIIPFGGGRRLCLGETMAKVSLFTYFTSFLQKYNFAQVPNKPIPSIEARVGFTLSPQVYDVVISYR